MRRLVPALVTAFVLVASAPTAVSDQAEDDALCIIFITPSADFRRVTVQVDLILTNATIAEYEDALDVDEDGNITADEVAAYQAASGRVPTGEERTRNIVRMDGADPSSVRNWNLLTGFEGKVNASRAVKVGEMREYWFNGTDTGADGHVISGGTPIDYGPQVVIETVVVRAPKDWIITIANNESVNAEAWTRKGFDTRAPFVIAFAWNGTKDDGFFTPAPSLAAVVLVLGGVALATASRATTGGCSVTALEQRSRPRRGHRLP